MPIFKFWVFVILFGPYTDSNAYIDPGTGSIIFQSLMATGLVVLLFLGILVCGMIISYRAPDPFGRLLAFGFTMMLVLQAALLVKALLVVAQKVVVEGVVAKEVAVMTHPEPHLF